MLLYEHYQNYYDFFAYRQINSNSNHLNTIRVTNEYTKWTHKGTNYGIEDHHPKHDLLKHGCNYLSFMTE